MSELLSIKDAAARGIERLRMPIWANPLDHLKIDIIDNAPGPWAHLWCPINKGIGNGDPIHMLCINMDYNGKCYVPYTGPLPDSEEYTAAVADFVERFKK